MYHIRVRSDSVVDRVAGVRRVSPQYVKDQFEK